MQIVPFQFAISSGSQQSIHHIGIGTAAFLKGFGILNGPPERTVLAPFQQEGGTSQRIALDIHFVQCDLAGSQSIGESHFCGLPLGNGDGLGIFGSAMIEGILRNQLLNGVCSRQKLGQDLAVFIGSEGGTFNFLALVIRDFEQPASNTALGFHGFDNLHFAILDVCEDNLGVFMGLDFKFLDGFINQPVFIFKASVLVTGFFGPVSAGVHVITDFSFFIGNHGADFLSAGFVSIDGDMPALQGFTGVCLLMEPTQTLFTVHPFIHNCLTSHNGYIMESQLTVPVVIFSLQFDNSVTAQWQVFRTGITIIISGVFSYDMGILVGDTEGPAA